MRPRSFTAVIATLSGAVVKTLVAGGLPDAESWGAVASSLIGALATTEDSTLKHLERIEGKVDHLILEAYRRPLAEARHHLRAAGDSHRRPKERERMLAEARSRFIEAVSAAPDRPSAAHAYWCLGVAWLASGSLQDGRIALARSADESTHALTDALGLMRDPPGAQVAERTARYMSTLDRLANEVGLGDGGAQQRAVAEIRSIAAKRLEAAWDHLAGVQQARELLGVPPGKCRVPAVIRRGRITWYSPVLVVQGSNGINVVGDLTVRIHESVSWTTRVGRPSNVIDIDVGLAANVDGPTLIVGFQPLHRWEIDGSNLVGPARLSAPVRPLRNPLRGQSIVQGGADRASNDRLLVRPGRQRRGWLRLGCESQRVGSTHDRDHRAMLPFVGLRVAFGPMVTPPNNMGRAVSSDMRTLDILLPLPRVPTSPRLLAAATPTRQTPVKQIRIARLPGNRRPTR